jgi:hypothetical protein
MVPYGNHNNNDEHSSASNDSIGILCNDPMGLCLSAEGSSVMRGMLSNNTSGCITTITKLAAQLSPNHQISTTAAITSNSNIRMSGSEEGYTPPPETIPTSTGTSASHPTIIAPMITIETNNFAIIVKDCDGYAVAMQVPTCDSTLDATSLVPPTS